MDDRERKVLHAELDALALSPRFMRRRFPGEVPPAAAPHQDAVWNPFEGIWLESDAALRKRTTNTLNQGEQRDD